jgi:hypothetical protein
MQRLNMVFGYDSRAGVKERRGWRSPLDWTVLSGLGSNMANTHKIRTRECWRVTYRQAVGRQIGRMLVPDDAKYRRKAHTHGRRCRHEHHCGGRPKRCGVRLPLLKRPECFDAAPASVMRYDDDDAARVAVFVKRARITA